METLKNYKLTTVLRDTTMFISETATYEEWEAAIKAQHPNAEFRTETSRQRITAYNHDLDEPFVGHYDTSHRCYGDVFTAEVVA